MKKEDLKNLSKIFANGENGIKERAWQIYLIELFDEGIH